MRNWVGPLIKLVIFLVVTAVLTYVLGATIANSSFGSTNTYSAEFSDVTGLQIGDDVRIAGVRVGTVKNIKLDTYEIADKLTGKKKQFGYADVEFSVEKSHLLPQSSEVHLRYRNLVGQRYLDIEQGPGDPNKTLKPDSTIACAHTPHGPVCDRTFPAVDLTVLFNGFAPLTKGLSAPEINQLSFNLIRTLQGEGGAIQALLSTVADLTNSLADKDQLIGDVIDNLTSALQVVAKHDRELSDLIIQLRNFIGGLADDRNTIGKAIVGVNRLAQSTTGLLKHVRGPFAEDVKSITGLVNTLNANSGTLTYVIRQLPPTVGALIRTASYGSWFNFYLCSSSGYLVLPGPRVPGKNPLPLGDVVNGSHPRCNS
ncbi:MAG TPA: MlaD family protein [Jatrophihabitans sp.]|jgi:phospholipid/cholesterol/gamma-HCH transport system substrate-binding protein|nr:MlaD family protein [Jatrophihabitans sp.]